MSPHGQRHRRHRPLCPSPEPPLRVPAAGRSLRSGPGPPECVQTRPPVPATPGPTLGASLVTLGGDPRDAPPQTSATVLECAWIPSDGGARRESPGSRRRRVRGVCTNRSRAHRFRKPEWLIKVHAGTEELWSVATSEQPWSELAGQPAPRSYRRPCQIRARCSGCRRSAAGSHRETDRHSPTNTPTSHPSSGAISAAWRVKDSNLGRHQPTDLQSAPIGRSGNPPGGRWTGRWPRYTACDDECEPA
jgi:hypothetical protein